MRIATWVVLALVVSVTAVSAQTPYIAVYFNDALTQEGLLATAAESCPGLNVPGELFIAFSNANAWVSAVEFAVDYPPQIVHLADADTQPVTVGQTPNGLSMGWSTPQNGFLSAIFVCRVIFLWNCDGCQATKVPIVVVPHPATNFLGYTDFPNFNQFPAVGLTALFCATVPTEDTTWGQVKALYGE